MMTSIFKTKKALQPAYLLPKVLSFLMVFSVFFGVFFASTNALAHKPSDSYLTMSVPKDGSDQSSNVSVRWDIALRDLDYVLQLDRDNDGALTWGEVRSRGDDITKYATANLVLSSKDKPCALTTTAPMQRIGVPRTRNGKRNTTNAARHTSCVMNGVTGLRAPHSGHSTIRTPSKTKRHP